jgi:large subunit ribosomal protein L13
MKTFSLRKEDVTRQWHLLDASEVPLGRLSTVAASLLLGKGKPTITSHVDGGDYVVVINADQLVVTGNKLDNKNYYRHSGYPGGIYKRTLREAKEKDSTAVIRHAVRGMLPDNRLRDGRLLRLKIYTGEVHNHTAQQPKPYSLKKGKK